MSAGAGGSLGLAGASANNAGATSGATAGENGFSGAGGSGANPGSAGAGVGGALGVGGQGAAGAANAGMSGAANAGAGGAMPMLGCASWLVRTGFATEGTAAITGGALVLDRPAGAKTYDDGPTLTQSGLSGDFDITITWRNFVPGDSKSGSGPNFQAGVFWREPSGLLYSATASVGGATGQASIIHGQQFTINSLPESATFFAGAAGTFRIRRAANEMTVVTTIDGQAITAQSSEPFPEEPLYLSLWMNDSSSSGAQEADVTVTRVAVSGGGGTVKADDFSCP